MGSQNVDITPGSGQIILADLVTDPGVGDVEANVQYVKIMDGTPGSVNKAIVNAQGQLEFTEAPYVATPLGYQQIVGLASSTALTVPGGATYALISMEGAMARWRDDGVAPTGSIGMPINSGPVERFSGDLAALRFITTGGSATLNASFYR